MNKNTSNLSKTRFYLKNYNQFKIAIKNLSDDMEALQKNLQQENTAPISKYGESSGDRNNEFTVVEAFVIKREQCQAKIIEIQNNLNVINRIIKKIDRAIEGLGDLDRKVIVAYYFDNKSWREIAQKNYISEQWAKERRNKAVKQVSRMIFGVTAIPEQIDLFI